MDFSISERQRYWRDRVVTFMAKHVYPAVDTVQAQMEGFGKDRWKVIPVLEELKAKAKAEGGLYKNEFRVKWPDGEWSHPYRIFANQFVIVDRSKPQAAYWYAGR